MLRDWLNLALRWAHVFSAIMWVGQTFFFTWLDRRFRNEQNVWMVHSGGFYIVDKQKVPKLMPQALHWFKWEAAFTWLTGLSLFILVYYTGGMMQPGRFSVAQQIGISIGGFIIGWLVYDLLWISPLAKHEIVLVVISYLLLVGAIYGYSQVFDGRVAWLQTGAMLGTFMAWNVWVRILPAQRQLIGAAKAGEQPDMRLAERARHRSKQNTFIVIPVVMMMLSQHFPIATNGFDWRYLCVLILVGWGVAKVIREH